MATVVLLYSSEFLIVFLSFSNNCLRHLPTCDHAICSRGAILSSNRSPSVERGAGFAGLIRQAGRGGRGISFSDLPLQSGRASSLSPCQRTSILGAVFDVEFCIETKGLNLGSLRSGAEPISSP